MRWRKLDKDCFYAGAQTYLLFEHDEKERLLYDEDGHMILRKGFIQSGLNCDPFSFNTECAELNAQWEKIGVRTMSLPITIS